VRPTSDGVVAFAGTRARLNLFIPRKAVRALAPQPISPLVAGAVSGLLRVNAPTQAPLRSTTTIAL